MASSQLGTASGSTAEFYALLLTLIAGLMLVSAANELVLVNWGGDAIKAYELVNFYAAREDIMTTYLKVYCRRHWRARRRCDSEG